MSDWVLLGSDDLGALLALLHSYQLKYDPEAYVELWSNGALRIHWETEAGEQYADFTLEEGEIYRFDGTLVNRAGHSVRSVKWLTGREQTP